MAAETESLNILIKAKDMYSTELTRMVKKFKVAGVAIAGAMTASLLKIAKETAAVGDMFQKMSIRTGVATQTLSELAHVAELSGTNIQTVEVAMRRMARVASDAQNGLAGAELTLEQLGITAQKTNGELKNTEELFFESIEALRQIESQTKRTALAQEIFGRSGVELLTIVNETGDSVEKLRKEARDLGITFDQQAANEAAKFTDEIDRLNKSIKGLSNEIGKTLVPFLADTAQGWVNIIQKIKAYANEGPTVDDITKKIDDQRSAIDALNQRIEKSLSIDIFRKDALRVEINRRKEIIAALNEERAAIANRDKEAARQPERARGIGAAMPSAEAFQINAAELRSLNAQFNFEMLELQQQSEQTAQEARQQAIDAEINQSMAAFEAEMAIEQQKNEALGILSMDRYALEQERREADLAAEIRNGQLRRQAARNTAQGIVSILEAFNTLSDNKNRSLFEALKLARASQAIVDTYTAANNALATVPYPYNFAAAFAVTAAGLANLAVISKTQFGSTAGAGGGGAAAPTAPPIRPITQAGVAERAAAAPAITFNISGTLGTEDWDQIAEEHIMPAINTALDRNSATLNVRTT
jgi:hypothetical protein